MTTNYRSNPVHEIAYEVNFDTTNISSGVEIGSLPSGAEIILIDVYIATVFNAGASNSLTVGISAAGVELATAAETGCGVAGVKRPMAAYALNPLGANRTIYTRYTQTGGAATTGKARITILWTRVA